MTDTSSRSAKTAGLTRQDAEQAAQSIITFAIGSALAALHDGHPPGAEPLISDVRQSGSSPDMLTSVELPLTAEHDLPEGAVRFQNSSE